MLPFVVQQIAEDNQLGIETLCLHGDAWKVNSS
jgi:hypothetical protein